MTPRLDHLRVLTPQGFARLAYAEWGPAEASRVVVCVHGLTRLGRDFDKLAAALAGRGARVIAPDMPGRGASDRLAAEHYSYPVYAAVAAALLVRARASEIAWLGTSMGGIIGMMLAAQPNTPITRLVLNDVGAFIPKASLARIATYVGVDPRFATMVEAEAYLRRVHAPFGKLGDDDWRHMARHSIVDGPDGKRLHYDPAIAKPFVEGELRDVDLWPVWEKVACPTLIVRGADSDLLLESTASEMAGRGAAAGKVRIETIAGAGHAPALMDPRQIALVGDFLLG